jgi:hypothetical protein
LLRRAAQRALLLGPRAGLRSRRRARLDPRSGAEALGSERVDELFTHLQELFIF